RHTRCYRDWSSDVCSSDLDRCGHDGRAGGGNRRMEREDHGGDMNHWIVKTEPSTYSYDDLARQKTAVWDGVKNNLALKHLREMRSEERRVGKEWRCGR